MEYIIVIAILLLIFVIWSLNKKPKINIKDFPADWRILLRKNVQFYDFLSPTGKEKFEYRVLDFLRRYRITGIKTKITDLDKLLVASSGIIPTFNLPKWRYSGLDEIIVFPSQFNLKWQTGKNIKGPKMLGMVGDGIYDGKMWLSKKSLHRGFQNNEDKHNVGIHEFIHLIDKEDGSIDGVPQALIDHSYTIPWMRLVKTKMARKDSDIRKYGMVNEMEFFTVVSEYFFENPAALKKNHPDLYKALKKIFRADPVEFMRGKKRSILGPNEPCVCGSDQKFKYCCGEEHYKK